MPDTQPRPFISVVMGSVSDWTVMKRAVEMLRHFDVRVETRVISAHRMPDQMFAYAQSAQERGLADIWSGMRCAEITRVSTRTSKWRNISTARFITVQSETEPITTLMKGRGCVSGMAWVF